MRRRLDGLCGGLVSLIVLAELSGVAAAADAVDDDGGLTEIVVTAQRREQRLQDVPVSVSVVSGDSLEQAGLRSLNDVTARLPNVQITSGAIVDNVVIRGVGSGTNGGFEQAVATFVDGVYRSRSRSTRTALFDVDRIEVLKGPQTTFFGANVIAGAINITTRRPGSTPSYNVSALYTPDTGEYSFEGGFSTPLSDTLGVRVAGRASGMDGYVRNTVTGEDGPDERATQGRIALAWRPTDAIDVDFRFDAGRSSTRNAMPLELVDCPPPPPIEQPANASCRAYLNANGGSVDDKLDWRTANGPSDGRFEFQEAALTNAFRIGPGTLVTTTGYTEHEFEAYAQVIPFPYPGTVRGYNGQPTYQTETYSQLSQEIRYQSETGGRFEYMVGGYASTDDLDLLTQVGFFFAPFGAFNPRGTTDATTPIVGSFWHLQETDSLSAFASVTYRPIENLRINLGARYSSIRKEAERIFNYGTADGRVSWESFQPFDPETEVIMNEVLGTELGNFPDPKRRDSKFMPSLSVQYDFDPNVMGYVSYARGFKAGGWGATSRLVSFGPETVDSYELGIKAQFLNRRLMLNAALYRSEYSDLQEASLFALPSGAVVALIGNVAESRSQGVETSVAFRLTPQVTLTADVAYLDAKYTSYPDGACTILQQFTTPGCIQDLTGKRRGYAPEWSGNVGAVFSLPLGADYELRAEPLVYFASKHFQSATADPLLAQSGYAKVDLRLSLAPFNGNWEAAVIGRNLTDKATSGFRQAVTGSPGSVGVLPDPPRTISLQVSYRK